jgi:glycosyltransferase involved in cell wall biosynthesis
MNIPVISVIMPVYNGEKYLREAIESILNQMFGDFEFIIIDDGSLDESIQLIESYKDERIVLIKNENNMGISKSLNKAILASKGKYIARMDADDISLPNRLKIQLDFLEKNSDIGMCGAYIEAFSDTVNTTWKYPLESEKIKAELLFTCVFAHPVVMFRKNIFLENKLFYCNAIPYAEDYELWCRAILHCDIANIGEILLRYRLHAEQSGQKYHNKQIVSSNNIRSNYLKNFGIIPNDEEIRIHFQLCNYQEIPSNLLLAWVNKLLESNKKVNFVNHDILVELLSEKLFNPLRLNNKLNQIYNKLDFLIRSQKKFIIYGAGTGANLILGYMKECIVYLIDRDINKINTLLEGKCIYSLESVQQNDHQIIISVFGREIEIIDDLSFKYNIPSENFIKLV